MSHLIPHFSYDIAKREVLTSFRFDKFNIYNHYCPNQQYSTYNQWPYFLTSKKLGSRKNVTHGCS